ncbi:Steroid 5-alpha-reductase det2 [Nowakowskiella sp. JEL0078]|nr:Steroid 5-alpha-reductase det2 [Nowakowskiella sp. JEL0078]
MAPSIAPVNIVTTLVACIFNVLNGYNNGRDVAHTTIYENSEVYSVRFIIGVLIFIWGLITNIYCDYALFALRSKAKQLESNSGQNLLQEITEDYVISPSGSFYFIPHGYLFELISGANYFGECIEWIGWAIACRNWSGLAFCVYVLANLVPHALDVHCWYKEKFGEKYPKNRKAIIPFLL